MSEHPHELLAQYVDGVLEADDRRRVEAHLASCPSCPAEVELARESRESLRGLPELAPPPGLTFGVLRRARPPRGGHAAWRWAAAGVAAAVIAIGAVVISRGQIAPFGADDAAAPGADAGAPTAPRQGATRPEKAGQERAATTEAGDAAFSALDARTGPRFGASDRDYDLELLADLGRRLNAEARASIESGFPQPATDFYERFRVEDFPPAAQRAAACILHELPPKELAVPFLIQEASFEGQPVYVAAFLQGPEADQPYDRLLVWVLNRDGCALRYYATIPL